MASALTMESHFSIAKQRVMSRKHGETPPGARRQGMSRIFVLELRDVSITMKKTISTREGNFSTRARMQFRMPEGAYIETLVKVTVSEAG